MTFPPESGDYVILIDFFIRDARRGPHTAAHIRPKRVRIRALPVRLPRRRRISQQDTLVEPFEDLGVGALIGRRQPLSEQVRAQLSRVVDAHRRHDPHGLGDSGLLIVVDAFALVGDVEGAGPPRVLGGDADGAVIGVAALRLDAPDGHHHRAGGIRVVRTLDQPFDDVVAGGHLSARTDPDAVAQPHTDQRVVHRHQPVGQGQTDVILVFQRRSGGSTLSTVDDDEVRGGVLGEHRLAHCEDVDPRAQAELETHGFAARQLSQSHDEADQLTRRRERRVCGRTHALLSLRHTAIAGDLGGHLRRRQDAADTRLGTLAQFDVDGLDTVVGGFLRERVGIEMPVGGAGSEVAGADLPDDVGALEVKRRQTTFAGLVDEPALHRTFVQGAQRIRRERAEAHRRHVQQRHVVRAGAVGPADTDAKRLGRILDRGGRVDEVLVAGPVDVTLGAEGELGGSAFGAFVDQRAGVAIIGPAVEVPLDEVLLHLRAQRLEQEPHVAEHRIIPQDRMPALRDVVDGHHGEGHQDHRGDDPRPRPFDGRDHPGHRRDNEDGYCDKPDHTVPHSPGTPFAAQPVSGCRRPGTSLAADAVAAVRTCTDQS
nr:hypothetical protein [Gordonia polyisoprenivorans]